MFRNWKHKEGPVFPTSRFPSYYFMRSVHKILFLKYEGRNFQSVLQLQKCVEISAFSFVISASKEPSLAT